VINLKSNHWLGLSALLLIISFFFYKSIVSEAPFKDSLDDIKHLHDLQIVLHRDILRYRNSQIYQYDTLNKSIEQVLEANRKLKASNISGAHPEISKSIVKLKATIAHQEILVEDFKTHHSILQNSLIYYSRMSKEIYGSKRKRNSHLSGNVLGKLSSLILEYTGKPRHEIALKIFPVIDSLNRKPTIEINTLINHSLIIIEKLPEIDAILETFNTLNAEQQINNIRKTMLTITDEHRKEIKIFN
jgi:hypothetical protein